MAYGGAAYDDDKPWWKEEDNKNTATTSTQPRDDFDSPPPPKNNKSYHQSSTSQPANFHGSSNGGSYGVYNKYGGSAYDDHVDVFSSVYNKSKPQKHTSSNNHNAKLDPYDAIRAKSKINPLPKQNQSNAYSNHSKPSYSQTKSASFATKPIISSTKSASYKSEPSLFKKPTHTQRNVKKNTSYSRSNYANTNNVSNGAGVSNPAYRRHQLRNKYGNRNNDTRTIKRPLRQRPELNTLEQQQEYKEQLKEDTKSHLDKALSTAYQTEDLAADTSEKLYYQRKQLENVDKMLHETDQHLDRTEHTLKGMKSIWGGIANYFKKAPQRTAYQKPETKKNKAHINNKMMAIEKNRVQNGYGNGYNNNKVKLGGSHEEDKEFNDKLDELHNSVKRMKVMAQNMNQELEDQDGLLDNIDNKMTKVDDRIHKQNFTMKRIR